MRSSTADSSADRAAAAGMPQSGRMAFRLVVWSVACVVCLAVPPISAAAQGTGGPGSIAGVVTDMDDNPLARAQVAIVGMSLIAYSNDEGHFVVLGIAPGTQKLVVKMLGYGPLTVPIEVRPGRTSQLQIVMTAEPMELEEVAISADPGVFIPPHMRAFEERRARGNGTFFTYEEIRRIQPRLFTDVLRRIPGMRIHTSRVQSGRNDQLMRACPVMFYLNGAPLPMSLDASINNFVAADEVVAIEFYNSAQVPPQFNSTMYSVRCGLVLVWTRSGPEPPRRGGSRVSRQ